MSGGGLATMIDGVVDPAFVPVRAAFEENFRSLGEYGGSVCVYRHGRCVADLWGGLVADGRPWRQGTIAPLFSVVKGATALVIQMLADRGELDVDERIVRYWPEFAAHGKADATVKMILCHTVGVPSFDDYWKLVSYDSDEGWEKTGEITQRIADQAPAWAPGSRVGYHPITFGWMLGEIVRRVTGSSIAAYFRRNVAEPLGLDLWLGELPPAEFERVAALQAPTGFGSYAGGQALLDEGHPGRAALFVGPLGRPLWEVANSPRYWAAEGAAAGGIGNARAVARMYAPLANGGVLDGVTLVSPVSIERHTAEQVRETDSLWGFDARIAMGYGRPREGFYFGPNDAAFGYTAFGGSIGFADPTTGIAFSYIMNQMRMVDHAEDPPLRALIDATYGCLER